MKTRPSSILAVLVAAILLPLSATNGRAWQFFTNEAGFTNVIATNSFTEGFDSIPVNSAIAELTNLAGNGFSFDATSTTSTIDSALYGLETQPPDKWLSVSSSPDAIVFTNFSTNVTAIGGNFFTTDYNGELASGTVTLTARLGNFTTVTTNVSTTSSTNFFGFAFGLPVRSFTISSTNGAFPTAHNVILATALDKVIDTNTIIVREGGSLFYSFVGATNLTCHVETTTNLASNSWTTNGVNTLPVEEVTPTLTRYSFEAPLQEEHQRFLRAVIGL